MTVWKYRSIDTMKDSRDTCYPPSSQLSATAIAQGVNLCATLNVTHITLDCFYDYPTYIALWVAAIRATGKNIWWRAHWNAWEGNNGVPVSMTPAQYLTATSAFIAANPTWFAPGDIFDAAAEPDQSAYWNNTYGVNWTNNSPNTATDAFNQFLLDCDTQMQTAFAGIGVSGIVTTIRSLPSFWATTPASLYASTVAALNNTVVLDSYPENSLTDPIACTNARVNELLTVVVARPGVNIVIGEMGFSNNVNVDDATQNAVLTAELAAIASKVPQVIGVNYWVGQGTATSGGYTHLFAGSDGNWSLRPAAGALATMYQLRALDWLDCSQMWVGVGGTRLDSLHGSPTVTNAVGQRSVAKLTSTDTGFLNTPTGTLLQIYRNGGLNLLSANQSNIEVDASGWIARNSATFSRQTTTVYDGTGALTVTTDGTKTGQGVNAYIGDTTLIIPGGTYTVSAWVLGTAGATINISMDHQGFGTVGTFVTTTMTGQWQRISQTCIMDAGPLTGSYGVSIRTSGNQATTFYVDDVQVEQDYQATAWKLGGTTGDVFYDGYVADAQRVRYGYSGYYGTQLTGMDQHYCADKRIAITAYSYRTCGEMFRDLIDNYLSAEGVTYTRGINLFTAEQSDVEGSNLTSSFNPSSTVTISQDTTGQALHGAGCLKVVTSGGTNQFEPIEVRVPASAFTPGESITLSCYAKASTGTPTLRFYCQGSSGSVGTVGNVTLSTSWQRFSVSVILPNPITQSWFALRFDTGSTAQAITYYLDELQCEVAQPKPWTPGGTGFNLLDAEQADIEGSTLGTDFAALGTGMTLSQNTVDVAAWHGNGVLKAVFDGSVAFQGVEAQLPHTALAAKTTYLISCYIQGTAGQTVRLFLRDDVNTAHIGQPQVITLTGVWTRYSVAATMPSSLTTGNYGLAIDDNGTNTAKTVYVDGLQWEAANATAWEVGGAPQTIQEGPLVNNYAVAGTPISKAFDDFAQYANFFWYIDFNKVAWFMAPDSTPAPFVFDGTQGELGSGTIETSSPLYRNAQWLLNVPDVTGQQIEIRKGDGTTRAFTMSYPFNSLPTVALNGVAQTVGQKGVDDATHSKQWYWNKGDAVLAQEVNNTILVSTDTLDVTYIGQWVSNVYIPDTSQIAAQQVIEGGGTSGIVEEAHQDNTIFSSAQAFQLGSALLSRYSIQGKQLTFNTRWNGLQPGQILTVNIPTTGWQLQNVTFFIEQVQLTIVGPWAMFAVTAIVGPFNSNWVQFYQWMSSSTQVAGNAGGNNQVSNVVQVFTTLWSWASTFTATTYTCPIAGPTTKCGPTVKVC